jgi:RNA polymerase subunit RPABC4/transcription elongation factor Spt4
MAVSDKQQTYPKNSNISLEFLARGVEQYLIQREDMVCQILQTPLGVSIQTKKKDEWKKFVLLDNAMQIDLSETDRTITAQIGGAKWVAKGAAMGVGMLIAWPIGVPLMALSTIGGFGTMNLPKKILSFIEQFLMSDGRNITIPETSAETRNYRQTAGQTCQACGAAFSGSPKFCPECGASAAPKQSSCQTCGATYTGTPKFCPECGSNLQ